MEVRKQIEEFGAKGVELLRPVGRHVQVAKLAAHDDAILRFGQSIVATAPWARSGERDPLLLEHGGDFVVDVLGAAVRTEPQDPEQLLEHRTQYGQHVFARERRHRRDDFRM